MPAPEVSVVAPRGAAPDYVSPYALRFTSDGGLLNAGFDQPPWNDPASESAQPVASWQAAHDRRLDGTWPRGAAWGPAACQYPAPVLPNRDLAYLRERVIAVAARQIGLAYQHHHIPSWVPPPGWAWSPVEAGANGPGLDCSNFVSFVFNYALGIKLPTAIGLQGAALSLPGPGGAPAASRRSRSPCRSMTRSIRRWLRPISSTFATAPAASSMWSFGWAASAGRRTAAR